MTLMEKGWSTGMNVSPVFSAHKTYLSDTWRNKDSSFALSKSSKKSKAKDGQTVIFPSGCKEGPISHGRWHLEPVSPCFSGQGTGTTSSTASSWELGQLFFQQEHVLLL